MYGIVLGIVFGIISKEWSFVLLVSLVHGLITAIIGHKLRILSNE